MAEVTHAALGLEWDTPLYAQARTQLEQALPVAAIPEHVAERLRYPERAIILTLPVRMDDGKVRSFPAYRVQHSSVLGPTKGGIRYDDAVNLGECAASGMERMRARRAPAARARRSASWIAGISPESTNWTLALRLAI